MKNFLAFFISIMVYLVCSGYSIQAQDQVSEEFLLTENSIGIVKVGTPLKELERKANSLGYKIKQNLTNYILYDKNNIPLITFTVFASHSRTKPVRTIKTSSSKYLLSDGTSLLGSTVEKLSKIFTEPAIYRVTPQKSSPEIIEFKDWPFKRNMIKEGYIIKYEAILNKIANEYGESLPVGVYLNEFCLFTENYAPEAKIDSFQIEAIEPKVKFEDK